MFRYMVELGGVSYDERGYLRGKKWTTWKAGTRYKTKEAAVEAYKKSGVYGPGVIYKTYAKGHSWSDDLWECKGTI